MRPCKSISINADSPAIGIRAIFDSDDPDDVHFRGLFFFAIVLRRISDRPDGGWSVRGWALLVLVGLLPIVIQYGSLLNSGTDSQFWRWLRLGVVLPALILFTSFLPSAFRGGMFVGFVTCLTVAGVFGALTTILLLQYSNTLNAAWKPESVLIGSFEIAVGLALLVGSLLGTAAKTGLIWIRPWDGTNHG